MFGAPETMLMSKIIILTLKGY